MTPHKLRQPSVIRMFLESEAAGGILLIVAAGCALVVANSPAATIYFETLHLAIGPMSAHHLINDGLMAFFFLLVGLEIKREFVDGQLQSWGDRMLPMLAAGAGMAVPAVIFLSITAGRPELLRGWAVPAATDIAFAMGVISLLGKRVPLSLKLLLATVAIVDDMGAVAIIAIGYTASISGPWLLASAIVMAGLFALGNSKVMRLWPYLIGFGLLWFTVLQSGVHATVAGVLVAAMVPVRLSPGAPDDALSPLHRLEHLLQKPVAFLIVPLFGFANAGVSFAGASFTDELVVAIAAGLFVGKQLGIFTAVWAAVRLGWAAKPAGASWTQIYGVALLCGIGFTMSLFIGDLAFVDATHESEVKLGIILGSVASAIAGAVLLGLAGRTKKRAA